MSWSEEPQAHEPNDPQSELHCSCLNDTPFFRNALFLSILAEMARTEDPK